MAHIHHIVEGNLSGEEKTPQHSSLFLLLICCSRVDLQVVLSNREKKTLSARDTALFICS